MLEHFLTSFIFSMTEKNAKCILCFHYLSFSQPQRTCLLLPLLFVQIQCSHILNYILCQNSSSFKLFIVLLAKNFCSLPKHVEFSKVFLKFSIKKLVWSIQKFVLQLLFLSEKLYPGLFTCPINFIAQKSVFSRDFDSLHHQSLQLHSRRNISNLK